MTTFEVIKGGSSLSGNGLTKEKRHERLKILTAHMRSIEANMSAIHQQGKILGWDDLSIKTNKIRTDIHNLLKMVKDNEKKLAIVLNKKPQISVITPDDK